jgi:chromosome partitioning protein
MKVIAVSNQKSSGKTTTTINVGTALAMQGYKVLLIDFDAQESLSNFFGFYGEEKNIAKLMFSTVNKESVDISGYVVHNSDNNVDIIPTNLLDMNNFSKLIISERGKETVLKRLITRNSFFEQYDFILIDCNASIDVTVDNALTAADYVLIPCWSAPFNYAPLSNTIMQIEDIKDELNPDIKILGIIATFCDRTANCAKTKEMLFENYNGYMCRTTISKTATADTSLKEKAAVLSNARANKTAIEYRELADELVERMKGV